MQYEEVTKPLIQLVLGALSVLLLIGGPLAAYAIWSSRGREVSVTVPAFISEPPADIHPALAGLLSDGSVQTRHILATLFDLARLPQDRGKPLCRESHFQLRQVRCTADK